MNYLNSIFKNTKMKLVGIATALTTTAFVATLTLVGGTARAAVGGPTCNVPTDYPTIQAAVSIPACTTVNVAAGVYPENVVIDHALTLIGAGSGGSGTVIEPASGNGITITGSGVSTASPLIVKNVRVTTSAADGIYFDSTVSHVALDNVAAVNNNYGIEVHNLAVVSDLSLTNVTATGNSVGFRVGTSGSVNGLTVTNSNFDSNTSDGWYITANSGSTTNQNDFTNINVSNTSFSNDTNKGIYAEMLDNAKFNNITIDHSGSSGSFGSGFNINEKYGQYQNITIKNSSVTNSGLGDPTNGTGLDIEARDDGSYSTNKATLTGVTVSGSIVTDNQVGIRFGETGKNNAGPTNVTVVRSDLSGSIVSGINNQTQSATTATCNWWGASNGPGLVGTGSGSRVSTNVTFAPWLVTSNLNGSCVPHTISAPHITSPSNGAKLTSAQLTKVNWSNVRGTSPVTYQYQAFYDSGYTHLAYSSGWLTASEIPTPGTPIGNYYVQVRAQDGSGNLSPWSNDASNPYLISVVAEVGPPTTLAQCYNGGWMIFNTPSFNNRDRCTDYVIHHEHRISGNVKYTAYGLSRDANFDMNTADNSGYFNYSDTSGSWYKVNVSDVTVNGNYGYFTGVVTSASNSSWVGQWLFAEVHNGHPDTIWGSFTTQSIGVGGVTNMTSPADGPFNVTKGNLEVN